jgi:radical SAM family uncharacterized protein/radical SAM-linked protein
LICRLPEHLIYKLVNEVKRPGRYYGNEVNLSAKTDAAVRFLLCFPDLYEIGMSNLGVRVLYHVLNRHPDAAADLVFAPWTDMEAFMRRNRQPLSGLGTSRAAREFHVLAFSLQHELQYTNVLNMIDLSGVPLQSVERTEGDPLILAGGPSAYNPAPMAEFIDAFVLGDGETVSGEIASCLAAAMAAGRSRKEKIELLAGIEGVYVPSLLGTSGSRPCVKRRVEPVLKEEDFPVPPIIPLIPVTHDRLTLEVMRGCTRGCRFCSAGMLGRPMRERSVDSVVRLANAGIDASGWEEVSLVSLSTSDYSGLQQLVERLASVLEPRHVSISLPSMRPGTFSDAIAQIVGRAKKTGLTFAPEAGSPGLRRTINKDVDEDELYSTLETAFRHGWEAVKLYFMIGLPGEDDADVDAMVNMVRSVESICRGYGRRNNVTVSLSPFVPRPHTPFQWKAQTRPEEILRRVRRIRKHLPGKRVKVKWRDPYMAALEGLLCRGTGSAARAIHLAWQRGARFDGWTDKFDYDLWMNCVGEAGIEAERIFRPVVPGEALPWEFLDNAVTRSFLLEEEARAARQELTPDCRTGPCSACGACPGKSPGDAGVESGIVETGWTAPGEGKDQSGEVRIRYRVKYAKREDMRFTSHLDVTRCIQRAFRRARLPVSFSSGYSPHPRIAFGPPLPLGMIGEGEYFDVLFSRDPAGPWLDRVNECLPRGLVLLKTRLVALQGASLMKYLNIADYLIEITANNGCDISEELALVEQELLADPRVLAVKPDRSGPAFRLDIRIRMSQGGARPERTVEKVLAGRDAHIKTIRRAMYRENQGILESPFGTPVQEEQKA